MALPSCVYPTMAGENIQIYSVQITRKYIFETPSPLGMIQSLVKPNVNNPLIKVWPGFSK